MDGLLVDSEASLDLEQSTSILDDPATLDATVEQLEGVESSDALIVEESSGEMIDVADEIIDVADLDDGTDWDIPEELVQQPETVLAATVVDGTPEASLAFLQVEEPVQPSIEELEDRILDDPDNPESHRALGEALLAAGDSVRGIDELDLALLGYENREDWEHALDLIRELIQVDPTSVRYYQKRVEVAYRTGDKDRLIVAYLELGDALVRTGALDKALAVYRRVAEHEPDNTRAQTALMTLAPPEEPAPTAAASTSRATPKSAPAPVENGDFIDLGMLVREEAGAAKDTRMRVEDEEPTGDEERDFKDMLSQFKRGIEQNLDSEDFQSHYDLGVAYKEMGLLDEAIAEFQKALRSPENRLRTSEALGVCFFEKNQPAIAEAILRRAVDSQAGGDDQKIGLLYWLGRSFEAQNKVEEALGIYRRVMAVDIQFGDLADRVSALNAGRVG
jgi:tetratricopeptide (TPR) repeat protein